MKRLSRFLSEQDVDKSKPRAIGEDEGTNDQKFLALMSEYKVQRREDPKAAGKLLDQANKLKDVSRKAKITAAYL